MIREERERQVTIRAAVIGVGSIGWNHARIYNELEGVWGSLGLLRGVSEGNMVRLKIEKREPLWVEIEAFVEAVREGGEPAVRGEDSLTALALAQRLVESGQESKMISLARGEGRG